MSRKEIGLVIAVVIGLTSISFAFATNNGVPFNELWEAIFGIQTDVTSVETQLEEALNTISALEERVTELESNPPGPGLIGLPEPDYDSDWRIWGEFHSYEHGLGTQNLFIYVTCMDGYRTRNWVPINEEIRMHTHGLTWEVTMTDITLKGASDEYNCRFLRVYAWIIPTNLVDTDSDGLSDVFETQHEFATDPTNPDTDGDGLSDYDEFWVWGTEQLYPDTDVDGLNDYEEVYVYWTYPVNPDSDGDGYTDGEEVNAGTDPRDTYDYPT